MQNVQLLTNAQIRATSVRAGKASVTDLNAMESYDIFWGGPPQTHTDFSPYTPTDTEIMRRISGGWNWLPRPVVLHIEGLNLAAGVHHFPHGSIIGGNPGLPNMSNTRPASGWPIGGHMCMYFKDSTGGTNGLREAAAGAFRIAQNMEDEEMRIQTIDQVEAWARPFVQRLIDQGILSGRDTSLDITMDMVRSWVVNERMIEDILKARK